MVQEEEELLPLSDRELRNAFLEKMYPWSFKRGDVTSVFLWAQRTLNEFIKTREKRGGGTIKYVPAWYVKQVLNLATQFRWSSYIDGHIQAGDSVIVWGRVEIEIEGKKYTQSAFGRHEVTYYKGTKTPVDIGDDFKAAYSDMIKKAASNWGIAADVYMGREE